jgi:hypothetical protein
VEEALRTLLLIALAGGALTSAAMGLAWWFETTRRLRRTLRRVLRSVPEAEAVDPGAGRAAGLNLQAGGLAVLWDRGASGLVYGLEELDGAELIVDGQVVARVLRDEPRKPLDAVDRNAEAVSLRLLFFDPQFPEFELELWGSQSAARTGEKPADAVRRGRKWLAHVEAVLRRSGRPATPARSAEPPQAPPPTVAPEAPPSLPWDDAQEEEDRA